MSNQAKNIDEQFYTRANNFINLANELLETIDKDRVSASMMFGCARFNAFIATMKAEYKGQLIDSKEDIISYFVEEYKNMLTANLEEYIENFDNYVKNKN
ncbi:DUF3144 domain-containing protein [Pasteurella bettyae]|uniref:DUF3144 domain-containing protein n=1 Tax=Pasteurella bettyae TaxID=752 RepID=UPI003D2CEE4D